MAAYFSNIRDERVRANAPSETRPTFCRLSPRFLLNAPSFNDEDIGTQSNAEKENIGERCTKKSARERAEERGEEVTAGAGIMPNKPT